MYSTASAHWTNQDITWSSLNSWPFCAVMRDDKSPPSQYVMTMHSESFPSTKNESRKATMLGWLSRCISSTSLRQLSLQRGGVGRRDDESSRSADAVESPPSR
jgi:glucose-6-phosphate dehydrogenase assembly protein OpcA